MTLALWIVLGIAIYIVGIPTIGQLLARKSLKLWQEAHKEVETILLARRREGLSFNSSAGLSYLFYFPGATLFSDVGLDVLPKTLVRAALREDEFGSEEEYKIIVALMWPFKFLYMCLTLCMVVLVLVLWVLGTMFVWVLDTVVRRPFMYISRKISE